MLWQGVLIIGADGASADGVLVASPSLVDSVILWRVLIVVRMGRGCKDGEGFLGMGRGRGCDGEEVTV